MTSDPTLDIATPDAATRAQISAADPGRSTWLTANAGSGKTRVLTDRVARLLLGGADPARILCLTYTKAAAAEMQVRLLRRLGEWAMLPEDDLRKALSRLGAPAPDAAGLARARRLFARAIETPGGLKIQTIHAFCAALLRRFPLEAGVPHRFSEMDERSAEILRADILEAMALDRDGPGRAALEALTRLHGGHEIGRFLAGIASHAAGFDPPLDGAAARALLGLPPDFDRATLCAQVFDGGEADLFTALIPHLRAGGSNDNKLAEALFALRPPFGTGTLAALEGALLFGASAKAPFAAKGDKLVTQATRKKMPGDLFDALAALAASVAEARPLRLALAAAERTAALHHFAGEFLHRYRAAKQARGWLDFDDLIARAGRLLHDPSVADWVLFRLDGGIDHVLVDEAQDTSPGQWQVIDRLTGEFTSGQGARRGAPTLFVVGDRKQSIYSFQGADLDEFDRRHRQFTEAFAAIGTPMQELSLAHSFRSAPAVLAAVDASFAPPHDAGLGGAPHHIAFHDAAPGRVDLWPVFADETLPEPENYDDPVDLPVPEGATARLSRAIAARIQAMIARGECLPNADGPPRRITEGDVLILVQRRSDLFGAVISACKQAGLAVAGADRIKLGAELAVADIRALLAFLATPEDDLSLAHALRSPLFALSEAELFALAQPRKGYLWEHLRAQEGHPALEMLHDLRDQADFLRPFDLIERLLNRHRGRERLLARLGAEAEDGLDMLLAQAMAYEQDDVPSLTGFLVWLAAGDLEVKRSTESGAGAIRVMTAHGAKGLEAPIVFLPDCARRRPNHQGKELLVPRDGPALWRGISAERPPAYADLVAEEEARATRERARLLYVAMTRAESWLIVAAAGEAEAPCWYDDVARGLSGLPLARLEDDDLPGPILRHASGDWPADLGPPDVAPDPVPDAPPPEPGDALPGWTLRAPDPAPRPPKVVSATALGGDKALPGGDTGLDLGFDGPDAGDELLAARARAAALARGTALHLLLEHLPDADPADWPDLAARLGVADPALLDNAARVLALEGLDPPGATILREAELRCPPLWPGSGAFHGVVDRLAVALDRVRVIDYKSNATLPASPAQVPSGILRQMAAYRAALRLIYPGRVVECAVLWSAEAVLMMLPDALLDDAFADAGAVAQGKAGRAGP